ncbi:MAG: metalloregulator ArsR/SmtB family transcription factor [Hyphomicrobiales bacterium]
MMHAFDVVGDPVRRRVLELLSKEPLASGAIVDIVSDEFGIGQSGISQHLKVLRENGFAQVTVQGARRVYEIDNSGLQEIDEWMATFRQYWEPKFEALATEVARGKHKKLTIKTKS